jgi:hypothetical protein
MLPTMSAPTAPTTPTTPHYLELDAIAERFTTKGWTSIRPDFETLNWAGRTILTRTLRAVDGAEARLVAALEADPEDDVARAVLADTLVRTGWGIRTGHRAKYVSASQFAQFFEYLRRAERLLIDATARTPQLQTAWEIRVTTARGLELGQSEAQRRWSRLATLDPHNVNGQSQLLQQLCPKWSGSWEAAFGFARERVAAAPDGALNGQLIVEAHIERCLDMSGAEQKAYLGGAEVLNEIRAAAERSVFHPAYQRDYGWVRAENHFAGAFSRAGDLASAARLFASLGGRRTPDPWDYFGDNAFSYYQNAALGATQ